MMSTQSRRPGSRAAILAEVKQISGRRIEERRRDKRMTQKQLAAQVGMGERWLREVESGSPKSRLDDHLRCAHGLGLSASHLLLPMLFLEHQMHFPRQIFDEDMHELEAGCIEFIASYRLKPFLRSIPIPLTDEGIDREA
ncbi:MULTISPECIES: helix-turn-helix domain-containing protein [Sphingobium]|uniref:helix-turn-helix domain-containing protein n=1 Tax=Sphingobium TaxID=165695 RepID=UPI0007703BFC|nr:MULTISPECIES: helix-turn-helix domain-containing protein [Sphingomonadaceae]AMK25819.1 hypothetical protein K426_24579 [Sphingobium sp. TKS]MCB4858267.1 helix-turn-helix domain-containing protein [Sphingobium sp. PNB]MEC6698573.1 helix-turn-helix domain-containing protein [Sphingobium sp. SJ10-10]